ncbi:MFS transporter [Portibacter marinus]|uniref:MFS transporter n=1 Tax=Portibacter marinus TaxID=2898660 RepID=UPI001F42FFDE|nr:MFS transporter [Portibacter marinus]
MDSSREKLYTFDFWMLCLSQVLFCASFSMIIPELPQHLTNLGGEEYKGLIISLFTLTAGISRPFSGKLTDTIGRIPVMVIGTLFCVVCSFLYPFMTSVFGFLLLRFFHGFSTGFKPTASSAYVADVVPISRRGEALGIMGVSFNLGASAGPAIGSWLTIIFGINTMFYISSLIAFISIFILLGLKESLVNKVSLTPRLLLLKKNEFIDFSAIAPAMVVVFIYFCFGGMLTIIPDQSIFLGIENKGIFFTYFTAFSILSRLFAGKLSDRLGRVIVIRFAIIALVLSLLFLAFASQGWMLLAAGCCIGFSIGIAAPALFAWCIDRSADENRGKALATVYIALEVGIGLGALLSAWIYDNDPDNFWKVMSLSALISLMAIIYLAYWNHRKKKGLSF